MPRYRLAKAAEHALNLEWLRSQIERLRLANSPHTVMLDRLEAKLAEDAQRLRWLENAATTPGMESHANSLAFVLAGSFQAMADNYLAGLLHQSPQELQWREILLREIRRLGLTWIDDLLVRLSRDLAVLSALRDDTSIPVLFAPPNQHETFMSLPGLYHEFGHCVERRFPDIMTELQAVVATFFAQERLKIGPLPPKLKKDRSDALGAATDYWDKTRLAEIFCDVFAGHVCGAANLLSIIDLARASGVPPCSVGHSYPPHSTRVTVSWELLTKDQREQPLAKGAWDDWKVFENRSPQSSQFQVYCPLVLLQKLAATSSDLITRLLPATPQLTQPLPSLAEAVVFVPGDNFERLVAHGMVALWEKPDDFLVWRARNFSAIGLLPPNH